MNDSLDYQTLLRLTTMLNANNDDFSIAVSNIENLKVSRVFCELLYKNINSIPKKVEFREHFKLDKDSLDLNNLNSKIKLKNLNVTNPNLVKYFTYTVINIYDKQLKYQNNK